MAKIVQRTANKVTTINRHRAVSVTLTFSPAVQVDIRYTDTDTVGINQISTGKRLRAARAATVHTSKATEIDALITAIFGEMIAEGTLAGTVVTEP